MAAVFDGELVAGLREAFARSGYGHARVREVLGAAAGGLVDLTSGPLSHWKTRGGSQIESLARLFIIGAAMPVESAAEALAPVTVEMGIDAGLLREAAADGCGGGGGCRGCGGGVEAALAIVPFEDLVLGADFSRRSMGEIAQHADHVMGMGRSSVALGRLALGEWLTEADGEARRSGDHGRTLDLGCGCGYLGLRAARAGASVVGVDLNPRAVEISRFNALLNGIPDAEFRIGSLFEPVRGERFDLILSNPPFVISPESESIYRDAGATPGFASDTGGGARRFGDEFCRRLAAEAPDHLSDGGMLVMLLNWSHTRDNPWRERLAGWVPAGMQGWLIRTDTQSIGEYASMWIRHTFSGGPGWCAERFFERFDAWIRYYQSLGIEEISYGALAIRRGSPAFTMIDDIDSAAIDRGLVPLRACMDGRALERSLPDDRALLERRWALEPDVRVAQLLSPDSGRWRAERSSIICGGREIAEGAASVVDVVMRASGNQSLVRLVEDAAGMLGVPRERLASDVAGIARAMVREGVLRPR